MLMSGVGERNGNSGLMFDVAPAPARCAAYLACMAVINGAKGVDEVSKTVKAGFGRVLRVRMPLFSLLLASTDAPYAYVRAAHLDDFTCVHRLRAAFPAPGAVGPVLQPDAVHHRGEQASYELLYTT